MLILCSEVASSGDKGERGVAEAVIVAVTVGPGAVIVTGSGPGMVVMNVTVVRLPVVLVAREEDSSGDLWELILKVIPIMRRTAVYSSSISILAETQRIERYW